jgi:hypothetical protein
MEAVRKGLRKAIPFHPEGLPAGGKGLPEGTSVAEMGGAEAHPTVYSGTPYGWLGAASVNQGDKIGAGTAKDIAAQIDPKENIVIDNPITIYVPW